MLFSEWKRKEVINIRDCRALGHVCDLEMDESSGCICKIIVSNSYKWFALFASDKEYEISYKDIRQVGPDIILVDISC